ncbi:non-specific serine/threonine protein kinase [Caenorhabditis elegans]|uniref:non-specific serine/threonine protein kinase n=1 Tax=Caenorhabditis elegans TaxID=6239 RepID=Q9BL96_CAEEL|nr:non-specific serine/threonine protein kinase [Caenorhabditis elegans]CCD73413.1 non-specific serine/threonine protein kinase [Caenorhabditis elegans]|eukprot:NP_490768.3 HASPin kinase related [Caenorhabditis elegans]
MSWMRFTKTAVVTTTVLALDMTNERRFQRQLKSHFRTVHAFELCMLAELNKRAPSARSAHPDSRNIPIGSITFHNKDPSMAQLLRVVGQKEAKPWGSLPTSALDARKVKKLGEGAYGEVFSTVWNGRPVAIKVLPFENNGCFYGNQSVEIPTTHAVLSEVIVMKELSALRDPNSWNSTPNFIEMISAQIVMGEYPKGLLRAWDAYDKLNESEHLRPDVYSSEHQNFILFVSANGGISLADFVLESEDELFSIIHQLVLSMVAAEAALEFEHRDLNLSNVLIDRNGVEELSYTVHGQKIPLRTHGIKVNIIDFTLSRISKDSTTIYWDLEEDTTIFEGPDAPQFEVYREMRENCRGNWEKFSRRTNLMWIVYIANRLIDTEICPEGLFTDKRRKELKHLFDRLAEFGSCEESLTDAEFYRDFYGKSIEMSHTTSQ